MRVNKTYEVKDSNFLCEICSIVMKNRSHVIEFEPGQDKAYTFKIFDNELDVNVLIVCSSCKQMLITETCVGFS